MLRTRNLKKRGKHIHDRHECPIDTARRNQGGIVDEGRRSQAALSVPALVTPERGRGGLAESQAMVDVGPRAAEVFVAVVPW